MAATSIEWTATYHEDGTVTKGHSINPIRARNKQTGAVGHYCEKISSGRAHCYSSAFQKRFKMPEFPGRKNPPTLAIGENGAVQISKDIEVFLDESKLQEILRRKKPTKIFWADMTDIFGSWVPDEWIDRCFAVMALAQRHTHMVLTKRPERMADYLADRDGTVAACDVSTQSRVAHHAESLARGLGEDVSSPWWDCWLENWPQPQIWLGTSVENQQQENERQPHLLRCPAVVRFLSVEPMLGPVEFSDVSGRSDCIATLGKRALDGIHWVIAGGESGHQARPCDIDWIRSIVGQCRAAGVPCFVKQLGARPFAGDLRHLPAVNYISAHDGRVKRDAIHWLESGEWLKLSDKKGGDISEWPEDLRIREFPQPVSQET